MYIGYYGLLLIAQLLSSLPTRTPLYLHSKYVNTWSILPWQGSFILSLLSYGLGRMHGHHSDHPCRKKYEIQGIPT